MNTCAAFHSVVNTPIGKLGLELVPDGLRRIVFERDLATTTLLGPRDDARARPFAVELESYFAGERREFTFPLAPEGTPFQRRVWQGLRAIPYGQTWSYAELASFIGRPTAVRAVGAANGRNPLPVVVPCHRVIGASGKLTGYAGGLDIKAQLLALESTQRRRVA